MPTAFRKRPIDEPFTDSDYKDIAKELKAKSRDQVSFVTHQISIQSRGDFPGHLIAHTLTGSFGPGDTYDPSRDPKEVAREAARITGEEIAKAFAARAV